jgi:dCTP deaminase
LNQLRLSVGSALLSDPEIHELHLSQPLLYRKGDPIPQEDLLIAGGLFLSLDLKGNKKNRRVGYKAKGFAPPLEMSNVDFYSPKRYWDPVYEEKDDRIILLPNNFYLLLSDEAVSIPPEYAAEMTAYDPTAGELRTHYAGFFDPGFGFDRENGYHGSRAALEVRAHDVPFMIEHGQRVCKLSFERMVAVPDVLYGEGIGSSYQRQADTLSKHFRQARQPRSTQVQPLFDEHDQNLSR